MCIAGGPSLTRSDVDLCRGQTCIVINDGYLLAPWATYLYWCDKKWWGWHKDRPEFKAFAGTRICHDPIEDTSVLRIQGKGTKGLSFDPAVVHTGSNSGFQALNIAVLMGASRILLLGYDMGFGPNDEAHWFGDHPDKVRSGYAGWIANYVVASGQLEACGVEVINCSRRTALQCFKRMELRDALAGG